MPLRIWMPSWAAGPVSATDCPIRILSAVTPFSAAAPCASTAANAASTLRSVPFDAIRFIPPPNVVATLMTPPRGTPVPPPASPRPIPSTACRPRRCIPPSARARRRPQPAAPEAAPRCADQANDPPAGRCRGGSARQGAAAAPARTAPPPHRRERRENPPPRKACRGYSPRRGTRAWSAAPAQWAAPGSLRPRRPGPPARPRRRPERRAWKPRGRQPRFAGARPVRADSRATMCGPPSAERRDLSEQFILLHRLYDVVARALAHAPDSIGLLALAGAHDHRDVLGAFVPAQRARGLVAALSRHYDVHQDQVGRPLLHFRERVLGAFGHGHGITALGQDVAQVLGVGG